MILEELFNVELVFKFKDLINEFVEDILEMFGKDLFIIN